MVSFNDALHTVLSTSGNWGTEIVTLADSLDRVLAEDIVADRDFPPFDRVSMDGIAINFEAFNKGQRTFRIEGMGPAGTPQIVLNAINSCVEIMTGAVCPANADTVIRYEDVDITDGLATININDVRQGQNVHKKGLDRSANDILIKSGQTISSAEIAVCATVGKSQIEVYKLPRVIVLSSGDELVDINDSPLPHQIRKSNAHAIIGLLKSFGIAGTFDHLPDDYDEILHKLGYILSAYDLVILSGGVSKGKKDYLPEVLDQLGVEKKFHKVKQRPGKPFWFGQYEKSTTIFALPGNPVSSYVGARRYIIPWIDNCLNRNRPQLYAKLKEDFIFKPRLTYFLEVKIEIDLNGNIQALPMKGNGSGDLANLVRTDGFLQLPDDRDVFNAGESFPLFLYRSV